jgi:hypothetical protein
LTAKVPAASAQAGQRRQRRKEMLLALLDQYTDRVDSAAEELGAFFDHRRLVGVRGLVAEQLNDPDFQLPSETQRKTAHERPRGGNPPRTKNERG